MFARPRGACRRTEPVAARSGSEAGASFRVATGSFLMGMGSRGTDKGGPDAPVRPLM